jgi:hypothetical protein
MGSSVGGSVLNPSPYKTGIRSADAPDRPCGPLSQLSPVDRVSGHRPSPQTNGHVRLAGKGPGRWREPLIAALDAVRRLPVGTGSRSHGHSPGLFAAPGSAAAAVTAWVARGAPALSRAGIASVWTLDGPAIDLRWTWYVPGRPGADAGERSNMSVTSAFTPRIGDAESLAGARLSGVAAGSAGAGTGSERISKDQGVSLKPLPARPGAGWCPLTSD